MTGDEVSGPEVMPKDGPSVVISQPMYFPWPGFFEQMALADIYIWLDDAQCSNRSFTNRIQVKHKDGRKWMTIPLDGRRTETLILELKAAGDAWHKSHRNILQQSLGGAAELDTALALYDKAVAHPVLVDCLIASCEVLADSLDVRPQKVFRSSDLSISSRSSQRIFDLVKAVGGTRYITGHGAAEYLDHLEFERQGISVEYMDYSLTPWPQLHGDFMPYVTALDLIATAGEEASSFLHPRTVPWREFLKSKGLPV
tara:strand:+ start:9666 stop:10433 length:768 start_codon:yes stop_codon:yes gene_type:complete